MVTISQKREKKKKKKRDLYFIGIIRRSIVWISLHHFCNNLKKKITHCNNRIIIKEGDNIIFGIYESVYCILKIFFQLYI